MTAVRVLRIIEYVYADGDTAMRDMNGWNLAASGNLKPSIGVSIRSVVIPSPWPDEYAEATAAAPLPTGNSFQAQKARAEATGKLPADAKHHSNE